MPLTPALSPRGDLKYIPNIIDKVIGAKPETAGKADDRNWEALITGGAG